MCVCVCVHASVYDLFVSGYMGVCVQECLSLVCLCICFVDVCAYACLCVQADINIFAFARNSQTFCLTSPFVLKFTEVPQASCLCGGLCM